MKSNGSSRKGRPGHLFAPKEVINGSFKFFSSSQNYIILNTNHFCLDSQKNHKRCRAYDLSVLSSSRSQRRCRPAGPTGGKAANFLVYFARYAVQPSPFFPILHAVGNLPLAQACGSGVVTLPARTREAPAAKSAPIARLAADFVILPPEPFPPTLSVFLLRQWQRVAEWDG